MEWREKNAMPYLTFGALDDPRYAAFSYAVTTRHGGVSEGENLRSMNMGTRTGDRLENVQKNYALFCDALGYPVKNVVLANQTHSLHVRKVTADDAGKGIFKPRDYTDVDALITNEKNLVLSIHTADCVPVTLLDPVNSAVGNAHCGWKGTFGALSAITLEAMRAAYGTEPQNVTALIGPCIHKCCYEVSFDLYQQFLETFRDTSLIFEKNGRYYLDLPGINRKTLHSAGVQTIFVSDLCTCCHKQDLFSHRGLGPGRGVMSTFISIKDDE